jgi:hypothetical protein
MKLAEGELLLRQGRHEAAVAVTGELLVTLRESGMKTYIPQALHLQGQAHLALGQTETGRDRLLEARALAETTSSRRLLWPILATLAEIEPIPAEAEPLLRQAREIIDYIAGHAPAALRDSFLALPRVRQLLDECSGLTSP